MSNKYIEKAEEKSKDSENESMPLDDFLEFAEKKKVPVADSVNYLLEAIDHFGTRTVFEDGRERERYVFFDDPYGDGEHAILGNTEELNEFVEEIRRRASNEGKNEKIIWFLGPTASGKSELKRCIINGLKGFSETEEGAKYTLEWTLDEQRTSEGGMAYGDTSLPNREYYKSPVNVNPLSVLPADVQREFIDDTELYGEVKTSLDPFSQESFDAISEEKTFKEMIDYEAVRAKRYYPDVGEGIGVLHSEDTGNPKQKLVGSWMEGAMQKFAKRGQKNPQAFSYDGVLSQGNGLVSIVEDAGHHSDVLDKMLNVCEEQMVKLDNKISMELDTIIMVFSNPDLEGQLEEYADAGHHDPLRALRRRLDKYEFGYLTTLSIEGMLIKRQLQDTSFLWKDSDRKEKLIESFTLYNTEIAPRAIEAAAMYEVVTRLSGHKTSLTEINEALLLEEGDIESESGTYIEADGNMDLDLGGGSGIPVTYTIDKIVDLAQENDAVLPQDIIEKMRDELEEEPMFGHEEVEPFHKESYQVEDYILNQQEGDVLEAMVGDVEVTEEDVREYIDGLIEWHDDVDDKEYDAYELREFETRFLGQSESNYDSDAMPNEKIVAFREELIAPINKFLWEQREEDFTTDDVPLSESPALEPLIADNDWDTVFRIFPEFDSTQWERPASNTETEELKEKTINRMVEMQGYSEESAETVSKRVVEEKVNVDEVVG